MLSQRDGYQLTDEISVRSGLRDDRPMQYAGRTLQRESKKQDAKLLATTSPTIMRFSIFFHQLTR